MRRRDVLAAKPNAAHLALAELEGHYEVTVITQNVDDLHERAGSSHVLHLHGSILEMRSEHDETTIFPIMEDMVYGALAADGGLLRPNIVWFEEPVPMIPRAVQLTRAADIFIVVGTSLQVYPAASLIDFVPDHVPKYIVDKKIPPVSSLPNMHLVEQPATIGMEELLKTLGVRP
jgi:NAD-dependent deacetylase